MCHEDGCCLLLKTYFAKFTTALLSDFKMPCVRAVYQATSTFCHISISQDDNLAEASLISYLWRRQVVWMIAAWTRLWVWKWKHVLRNLIRLASVLWWGLQDTCFRCRTHQPAAVLTGASGPCLFWCCPADRFWLSPPLQPPLPPAKTEVQEMNCELTGPYPLQNCYTSFQALWEFSSSVPFRTASHLPTLLNSSVQHWKTVESPQS